MAWWVLSGVLTLTAAGAEHVRRRSPAVGGVCIASSLLLQGTECSKRWRREGEAPL